MMNLLGLSDQGLVHCRSRQGKMPHLAVTYMTGDALAQTSLSRFYDNFVYSITQCSRSQHVHTVCVWMYSFVMTNICVFLYVRSAIVANAITLLASRVARAMPIVLASMRFANSWGKSLAQAIACWSVSSRSLQTVQDCDHKYIRNCVFCPTRLQMSFYERLHMFLVKCINPCNI